MTEKIVIAGFGGQGVLSLGQIIAQLAMIKDYHVTWFPSYGAEMRGGTANCHVIYSSEPIGNPIVSNDITTLIVFNTPSLDKFENKVIPGGKIIINSSVIERKVKRDDCNVYYIEATNIASEVGDLKVQNMVMLGEYVGITKHFTIDDIESTIKEKFAKKAEYIPLNIDAVKKGINNNKTSI